MYITCIDYQYYTYYAYGADSLKTSNILNYYYSVPRYKITKKNTLFDSSG